MNKRQALPTQLDYYGLYLLNYLTENRFAQATDKEFVRERAERAADTYEQSRREGLTPDAAQERAMDALTRGLRFSPFALLAEILEREFPDEVPQEDIAAVATALLPHLRGILSRNALSDDFAQSPEYDRLYSELTGAVALHIEAHGI